MRIRLLILFLLASIVSEGQVINASPSYRIRASACSYILDQFSDGYAAYSLRLLDCNYAGSCIRVRRSSDNTEQDIGFSGVQVDTAAIKTFVGTTGSDNGYVVTWYDQSGNGRDMAQATSTSQPAIILAGVVQRQGTNNMPSLYFDGGDYFTSSFLLAQPSTHFIVAKNDGTADRHFVDGTGGTRQLVGVSGGNLITYAGAVLTFGANSTAFNLYTAIFDGASSTITRNGAGTVTGNAGAFSLGGTPSIGNFTGKITGYMSEVIFFSASKASDQTGIEGNINTYYAIY